MSLPERTENRLYADFMEARATQKVLWPEPQTTALYKIVHTAALRVLSTRNSHVLYNYGRHVAAGRIAAEVLLNIDRFNGRSRFSTWLYRVARNELYDIVREVRGRMETQLGALPDMEVVFHEGQLRFPTGLLSAVEERCVRLRIEQGLNFRELAKVLDISLGGAHRLWHNALLKLRTRLTN